MAAYTTSTTGDVSNAATWGGTGPPGAGDTATITHNVTISSNWTVGLTAFTTGGTPAIAVSGSVAISHTGGVVTATGDIALNAAAQTVSWTMSAGTKININVPASQQAVFNFSNGNSTLVCNGTSGSHCTVTATLASGATCIWSADHVVYNEGVTVATYTDFSNFGTGSAFNGVLTTIDNGANVSITNCTFTATVYQSVLGQNNAQSGTFNFQMNTFSSSLGSTSQGIGLTVCAYFFFLSSTTSGGAISGNSFDTTISFYNWGTVSFTTNFVIGILVQNTGSWGSNSFSGNFFAVPNTSAFLSNGNVSGCYLYLATVGGAHGMLSEAIANQTYNDCIFEGGALTSNLPQGILIGQPTTGGTTITVTNCIGIPSAIGVPMTITFFGSATNAIGYFYHNTGFALHIGESGAETAGMIGAYKANLPWYPSYANTNYKLDDTTGLAGVGTPTTCDYNGSWGVNDAFPLAGSYTNAGNGYALNLSGEAGAHDVADQNPNFVDSTRSLATWGGTAAGGGVATIAGALAALAANPALITQATTGLMPWIRAGFKPQNTALDAASYPGDSSAVDAAGGAWPGGSPGIGAMAVLSVAPVPQYVLVSGQSYVISVGGVSYTLTSS